MLCGEYCSRDVIIVKEKESIRQAAALMREYHVGDLIVVDDSEDLMNVIGIITDRDIVVSVIAKDIDLETITVGDVMSHHVSSIHEEHSLLDALKIMRAKGVRRLPVLGPTDELVGILAVDDILTALSEQLTDISQIIVREQLKEKRHRL